MKKTTKKILIAVLIVALLGIFLAVQLSQGPLSSKFTLASLSSEPQRFIAHRGFSSVYPENTIPSIEGAVQNGFYGCEFDVHTTKDGVWILNHDSSIDKMTDGSGDISSYTYEELLEYNIDNGNGIENYKNLKLPKLEDALKLFTDNETVPFIEIKGYDTKSFSELLKLLDDAKLIDRAVIISFDMDALLAVRALDEDISLMYVTNHLTKEDVDICINNGNIGVDINGGLIFKMADAVKYAQENGLECAAWTIDIPLLADILNLYGIKNMTTNRIMPD